MRLFMFYEAKKTKIASRTVFTSPFTFIEVLTLSKLNENNNNMDIAHVKHLSIKPNQKVILGEGAFSKTYLAKETTSENTSQLIALKKMKPSSKLTEDLILKEMRIQNKLMKLNEKKYFSLAHSIFISRNKHGENKWYQCIPLADLGNGQQFIQRIENAHLSLNDYNYVRGYMTYHLLMLVESLHHQHFFHRDIKPENILFTSDGKIKLADFGSTICYRNGKETLTASNLSDSRYHPPHAITDLFYQPDYIPSAERDFYIKERLIDRWALALTLLQFYSLETRLLTQNTFLYYGSMLSTFTKKVTIDELKKLYDDTISFVKKFEHISPFLRDIISNLIELNPTKQKTITALLKQYHCKLNFYQNEKIFHLILNKIKQSTSNEYAHHYSAKGCP